MMTISISRRWSSALGIVLPSTNPIIVTPTANSEAPGRKKPISSPVSANTMANRPMTPNVSRRLLASSARGSRLRLVPLGPPETLAAICGDERAESPRKARHASFEREQSRCERDRVDLQLEVGDRGAASGRETVRVELLRRLHVVRRAELAIVLRVAEAQVHVGNSDVGAVETCVVVE